MGQLRDRNAVLMPNEIEAIKVTQEVIKRMADNSAKTKTVFLALFAAAVTLHKSITRMPLFSSEWPPSLSVCGTPMRSTFSLKGNSECIIRRLSTEPLAISTNGS